MGKILQIFPRVIVQDLTDPERVHSLITPICEDGHVAVIIAHKVKLSSISYKVPRDVLVDTQTDRESFCDLNCHLEDDPQGAKGVQEPRELIMMLVFY